MNLLQKTFSLANDWVGVMPSENPYLKIENHLTPLQQSVLNLKMDKVIIKALQTHKKDIFNVKLKPEQKENEFSLKENLKPLIIEKIKHFQELDGLKQKNNYYQNHFAQRVETLATQLVDIYVEEGKKNLRTPLSDQEHVVPFTLAKSINRLFQTQYTQTLKEIDSALVPLKIKSNLAQRLTQAMGLKKEEREPQIKVIIKSVESLELIADESLNLMLRALESQDMAKVNSILEKFNHFVVEESLGKVGQTYLPEKKQQTSTPKNNEEAIKKVNFNPPKMKSIAVQNEDYLRNIEYMEHIETEIQKKIQALIIQPILKTNSVSFSKSEIRLLISEILRLDVDKTYIAPNPAFFMRIMERAMGVHLFTKAQFEEKKRENLIEAIEYFLRILIENLQSAQRVQALKKAA